MWCYIIYSKSIDRFYIGISNSPQVRLKKHNDGEYGKNCFTIQASDWELFHTIKCSNLNQALKIEKHLKKMKSRKYLNNLKSYPEIQSKLLTRYST